MNIVTILFLLVFGANGLFALSVDYQQYRFQDDGSQVVWYEKSGVTLRKKQALLSQTLGSQKSFYDYWCDLAPDTCPANLAQLVKAKEAQVQRYQQRLREATSDIARTREKRQIDKTAAELATLSSRLNVVTDLVNARLKSTDPYDYDEELDPQEVAFIKIWLNVFAAKTAEEQKIAAEKAAEQRRLEQERQRQEQERAEERRQREAEERRREEERLNNQNWTCDTRCSYSYYWYSQEFGKREVTWHTSKTDTGVYCMGQGRSASDAAAQARPKCQTMCDQSCNRGRYGKSNFGCTLGALDCRKSSW